VTVTVSGDDDAADGDNFDVTLSSKDDTLVIDSYRSIAVNAGAGTDTLDLRDFSGTVGANNGDVNLTTGVAHANFNGTFINFENVYAHEDGGRLVGTVGSNKFWLNEGVDDIAGAGGDDTIFADGDTLALTDVLDGGSGTDTLSIDGESTLDLVDGTSDLTGIENIVVTGTDDDDVEITLSEALDVTATSTSAITGGIRNVKVADTGGDNSVVVTAAAGSKFINLIGVSFTNIQTLTLNADSGNADDGAILIDGNTLKGVETLTGDAGDLLTLNGGSYDFTGVDFDTLTDISGSNSSNETVTLGSLGDIVSIALGTSNSDVVTFGADVADISALTTFTGVETVRFGSASNVVLDDGHAANISTIEGTVSEDQLVFEGATVNGTNLTISGVETVVLDNSGAAAAFTVGLTTLSKGMTVIGDSGVDDIQMGADGVDISGVIFKDIEALDVAGQQVSSSIATQAGFARIDGAANGKLTLTDSGTLTLTTLAAGATGTFDIQGAKGDDTWTLTSFIDAVGVDILTGAGNDRVNIGSSTNTLTSLDINLESGDDTISVSSFPATGAIGSIVGGLGTDTILVTDTTSGAGSMLAADFLSFEKIVWSGASVADIALGLHATDVVVESVDMSGDTNASGANTLTFTLYNDNGLTITGSAGADTILTTGLGDTVNGGGGADAITVTGGALAAASSTKYSYVLTGGTGNDTYTIAADTYTATTGQHSVTITDWATGDVLNISAVSAGATEVGQGVSQALVDAAEPTTLTGALDALAAHAFSVLANRVYAFQFGGNTYVYADLDQAAATYDNTNDFLVKLNGLVTVDLTNFVTS
jgi:hypothetical protein